MARKWSAVLARLGVPTGDGRILAEGGITSRDLPLPLLWQRESSDGHGGAVVVGRIETMSFANGMVTATGSFLDVRGAAEAEALTDAGVTGPSVDLFDDIDVQEAITLVDAGVVGPNVTDNMDDVEYVMDEAGRVVVISGRIAAATLVSIPAFADVSINLDPQPVDEPYGYAMTASVRSSGWSDMPIADESRAWDGSAAAGRIFAWATDGDTTNWSKYARGFLRKDDSADPETKGAYGFGIADVINGTLTIVPRGVFAAAAAVQGARTGSAPADAEAMKRVLRGIYGRLNRDAPFSLERELADFGLTASAALTVTEPRPPLQWFANPQLTELTPLTVTDDGRVFGHIAGWETCHVGLPGCVTPPASQTGYSYFHVGEQRTEDGAVVPVGTLTVGGGHADAQLGFRAAAEHYDNVGAAVARVVAYDDDYGIAVAGWMLPNADAVRREQFMSSPVSGDWRRIGGSLEMIAVCAVNSPGFPVPRARVAFSNGAQRTLVGAFGVTAVQGTFSRTQENETDIATARARWAWAGTERD